MDDRPVEGLMERQPKKRGCFFWGCLTAGLLALAMGGCIGVGFYILRERMTSPAPEPIPTYEPKPGEIEAVEKRLERFEEAAEEARPARLELTGEDLNALVASDPDLKGKTFVRIEGEEVILELSVPLDGSGMPFMKGRWLNATLGMKVSLADGRLELIPEKIILKKERLGEDMRKALMETLRTIEIQKVKDVEFQEFLRKAKSVEVRDGKVIISR